jgi:hypothetical protein
MNVLKVECYAGYKGDQYPIRFYLQDRVLEVKDIEDQWYSPSARYFRVHASDGNIYVLKHNEEHDSWSLIAYRKTFNS